LRLHGAGQSEKLYLAGAASAFITVNGEASTQLDLNGSSFGFAYQNGDPG
jgi:hypothetical protein